jgi:hypothetical protein
MALSLNPWMAANRAKESGGNNYADNPYSSAYGPDQFISSTWLNLAKRYRPDLFKNRSASDVLNLRSDPKLSEEFVGYNNQENKNYLTSKGQSWNNTNMGLAHQFGPSGTMKLLSADPNTPIESVLSPDVIAANRKQLAGKTVGQVVGEFDARFQKTDPEAKGPMQVAMAEGGSAPTLQDAKGVLGITGPTIGAFGSTETGIQAPTNEAVTGAPASPDDDYSFGSRNYLKRGILGAGAGLSSIDNPQGAAIALGMMRDMAKNKEYDFIKGANGRLWKVSKTDGTVEPVGGADLGEDTSEFDKYDSREAAKDLTGTQQAIQDGANRMQKLATLRAYSENPNVYQGFAGGAVSVFKNAARTFGFDEASIGNDETQGFKALSNQFALSIRNPKAGEGLPGNLSDKDLAFLKQSAPGLENSPEGNRKIIDFMTAIEKRNMDYNQEKARYIEENRGRRGLAKHMEEWRNSHDALAPKDFTPSTSDDSEEDDGFKVIGVH